MKFTEDGIYLYVSTLKHMLEKARAFDAIQVRGQEAHEYTNKYNHSAHWGKNIWHVILDDAIALRKEKVNIKP